ncbi:MATE family efflux transporter [Sphingobacterium chuzhouense]|uniref:MATE family efflux transporter n=1 Tax=Sphingobacterium chuzhouense TaxID=1742264 RepID=A0ABR7XQZ1_9SPHI|nr:MATE family efflux transporter [Sphingobacterium chuzhouense]MBD1421563.1 MATE family efflux transporter [Sphingobacterium chuzhouense]
MIHRNYIRIIKLAFPVILANASVPLLGLADTAAIGQTGAAVDLGAIALASLIFNFVYWGFGFLRMGTTGFISQAAGANDLDETHALLFRTVLLGGGIGILLIILQRLIGETSISLLKASDEIRILVRDYFYIRIWGAPATLVTFTLLGTFIGMGWTKHLLFVQLFLNGLNILLNVLFVVGYDLGVRGIAFGTVIAEWSTLFFASYLLLKKMQLQGFSHRLQQLRSRVFNKEKLIALFKVNGDIMIRTLALLSGFAWFANQGADFGDQVLAANHVLLQFVSLSAFFLDGYAHVAEMLTGKAFGAKDKAYFIEQVRHSSILAGITALILACSVYMLSDLLIPLLTKDMQVQAIASAHSLYAAIYIALSFAAFQLDGIFIGVTKSVEMRNATLMALFIFIGSALLLTTPYGNVGLWISFIIYVVARAITLVIYYPKILRGMVIT